MSAHSDKARRRRRPASSPLSDVDGQDPDSWKSAVKEVLGDIRASSPTLQTFREHGLRLRESYDALRRAVQRARRQRAPQNSRGSGQQTLSTDLNRLLKDVGSRKESNLYAAGTLVFGAGLFIAGAAPWLLPACFLLFSAICFPWRIYTFSKRKWGFFLLDFCYWGNLATVAYLVFTPYNARIGAMVYALADGPLAAALIAWQSAWVFGSTEHSISVLIHLLPGLALFAHRYAPVPEVVGHTWRRMFGGAGRTDLTAQKPPEFFWVFGAPLIFYVVWQLMYFLIVQVMCRSFIKRGGYDTSYNALARRAAKNNNFWNRLVRKGSIMRRVCMYGLVQAIFTVSVLIFFIPIYYNFYLSLLWQVLKVVFPVYYGAQYQCVKMPRHAVIKALKAQQNEKIKGLQAAKAGNEKPGPAPEASSMRKAESPVAQPAEKLS
ncbi:g4904 [Coccomyxa viridis]|uniref:Glycerophosphocholine acyltransferase 1 n=1 Tax=Coccomyxa viridis TaxID=1274662 RepID=A0ABP1FUD4_9CHLO